MRMSYFDELASFPPKTAKQIAEAILALPEDQQNKPFAWRDTEYDCLVFTHGIFEVDKDGENALVITEKWPEELEKLIARHRAEQEILDARDRYRTQTRGLIDEERKLLP
jgi:hypothetical protein